MPDKLNAKIHVLQGRDELITSYYGIRTDPVTGKAKSSHLGIDLISGRGNKTVLAFADGTVTSTRNTYSRRTTDGSAGNYITITHTNGTKTMYKHLKKNSLLVKKGSAVKAGQAIATMGDTGHCTGVHLHFDVIINNKRVDPLPYLCGEKELFAKKTLFDNCGDNPTIRWGTQSHTDIVAFQSLMRRMKRYFGPVDGIAGKNTLKAAQNHLVKNRVDGEVSAWVQQRLKTLGYYTGLIDGEPRSLTAKAIKAFEADYGLTVDGKIADNDWYYLLAVE